MRRAIATMGVLAIATALFATMPTGDAGAAVDPIGIDISDRLRDVPAPPQLSPVEAAAVASAGTTAESQCGDADEYLTITLSSWDPANPGSQDVVFWKETPSVSTGKATLWVAWDFLDTAYGRHDAITCEQLATLQASMDKVVATDVKYFGQYDLRPAGNENIDVMIYNIVDESYFDPQFPFFIAGFFWSNVNEVFDRNMVFIDSYDWANRIGPSGTHPYDYEATVAHELQHLIHHDQDAGEVEFVDEGLADLAEYLNGFGHPESHVVYYLAFHRNSLTDWLGGLEDYGAAYLFQLYLLENFGTKTDGAWDPAWTLKLITEQEDGIAGVEAATGASFYNLFDSWILANYLDRPGLAGAGDFPLGYDEIDLTPFVSRNFSPWSIQRAVSDIYGSDAHGNLPVSRYYGGYVSGTVEWPVGALAPYAPLYGTYKGMIPTMAVNLRGDTISGVPPYAGSYEVASGGGNMLSDRILWLDVPVGGTLTFRTWFDIEEEWDYGFVEASTDGGATWTPIPGSITRHSVNPNQSTAWAHSLVAGQASTDAAITGSSGGWVQGTFTLPAASGVLVRFAYYTDEAVNGKGWFIDDVAVDGFSDGFETGVGNWTLGGWTRTTGQFSNDWIVGYAVPEKYGALEFGYFDSGPGADGYERILGAVDTSRLKGAAMVVFANRPGPSPFDAGYRIFVRKK